jgi:protein SCO1/2
MKKNYTTVFILALLVVLVGAVFLVSTRPKEASSEQREVLADLGFYFFNTPRVLSPVVLKNLNGEDASLQDKKGQWQLVNFGYMFCPDICPVNLKLLAKLKKEWDVSYPNHSFAVTNITFDPERDTPDNLRQYIAYHHPDFHGLTGDLHNIRQLAKQLNVVFIHEKPDEYGNYFITHSDSIALINPEGLFVGLFKGPYEQSNVEKVLHKIIGVPQ